MVVRGVLDRASPVVRREPRALSSVGVSHSEMDFDVRGNPTSHLLLKSNVEKPFLGP